MPQNCSCRLASTAMPDPSAARAPLGGAAAPAWQARAAVRSRLRRTARGSAAPRARGPGSKRMWCSMSGTLSISMRTGVAHLGRIGHRRDRALGGLQHLEGHLRRLRQQRAAPAPRAEGRHRGEREDVGARSAGSARAPSSCRRSSPPGCRAARRRRRARAAARGRRRGCAASPPAARRAGSRPR